MIYIISQIIGLLAFIISLMAYHQKTKTKIFTNMIISNFLNIIHYLMLGTFSGCITKVLAIIRDSFIIFKDKNEKLNNCRVIIHMSHN
ncbi:MAG TPA: YgjV family protein [Tenericutes bacterium]|nr:YgjV family protein [Mycoplasmatota bacterium]